VLARRCFVQEALRVKTARFISCLVAAAALVSMSAARADSTWLTDFKQAQERAKADHKLLLLDFTGSDWCGWCIKLKREVFSRPEFNDYATKNLVLMEVDFPRSKALAEKVQQQNMVLAQQYQIEGFPTIVVLNGDGKQVGALGYVPGGPEAFIAELEKLRKG
jgi:protein disulfide-isomerase